MPEHGKGGGGTVKQPQASHGPRRIFIGWTALVFVAAGAYYFAKTTNTEKKKRYLAAQHSSAFPR